MRGSGGKLKKDGGSVEAQGNAQSIGLPHIVKGASVMVISRFKV